MRIDFGARTDVGCVRDLNEDNLRAIPELNLFIVSDGLGGAAHGEVASELAVRTIEEYCREAKASPAPVQENAMLPGRSVRTSLLTAALHAANRAIYLAASADAEMRGMGATAVAIWLEGDLLSLAHVGDSRVYRLRGPQIEQLTRDHSLVAEQVRQGILTPEQAQHSPYQSVLLRALGPEKDVEVDAEEHRMREGDVYLLCSDGLSRMVPDGEIAKAVRAAKTSAKAAARLVEMAREAGGLDNITALVVRYGPRASGFARLFARRS